MTRPPTNARSAAAVMLIRGQGPDLEVFLVERSTELRFFGGYHAFVGGVRGAEDGPDEAGQPEPDLSALMRCAERELFEETGVLLDPNLRARWTVAQRSAMRRDLLDLGKDATSPWPAARGSEPARAQLRAICRICTPPFAPQRYDTVFFAAELAPGEEPSIETGELVAGRFWRPSQALAAWRRGEMLIVPPALLLLELLRHGDLDRFARDAAALAARYADGALHHVRFSPGIVMASVRTPTLPPATTTNCFLCGEEKLWIVDPATPHADEQGRLFELIDDLAREGRPPAGILVSHHHRDHVGAVVATSRRYDLPVLAHEHTLAHLPPGSVRTQAIGDGARIPLGRAPDGSPGWELIASFTPGHDPGHLCFRETRYDAVLVGDMLSTVSTIVIDPPEGHLRTYLRSLDKLLEQPMSTLYPAHGPAMRDGHRLLRQYVRHRQQREAALLKALAETGPCLAHDLVPKVYWDTDPRMFGLAERSLIAGLDKLVEDGRARLREDRHWEAVGETG
ncbi:MAG: MBL fold metallo-hydrolase [Planctomycetota bacterium]